MSAGTGRRDRFGHAARVGLAVLLIFLGLLVITPSAEATTGGSHAYDVALHTAPTRATAPAASVAVVARPSRESARSAVGREPSSVALVVAAEDETELASTPGGRVYSWHYLNETGPLRNIPGSVVDETIDHYTEVTQLGDRTIYYDAKNDVTVVQSDTTGKIMSVRKGAP